MLARRGNLEEAERLLAAAESALAHRDDLLLRLHTRTVRAGFLHERGDRVEAFDELLSILALAERSGYLILALTQRPFRRRRAA